MCKIAVKEARGWAVTNADDAYIGRRISRTDLMNSIFYQNVNDDIDSQKTLESLYNSILKTERKEGKYITGFRVSNANWRALKPCMAVD